MKMLFAAAFLISSISFAQTTPVVPPTPTPAPVFASLKDGMKDMKKILKDISAQAKDATKNADSEKLALDLAKSVTAAKAHIPKTAPDKAGQDLYIHMMDGVIQSANDLAAAFHENDNAKAIIILSTLSQQKSEGHERFNQ